MNQVVIVTPDDSPIATMSELDAHRLGLLHRAASAFIFNAKGEWLIQRRSIKKYHSTGLWSNATNTHVSEHENSLYAVQRSLQEEMGIEIKLRAAFNSIYKTNLDYGLIEHELAHVYIGYINNAPLPHIDHVSDYKFISTNQLKKEIKNHPDKYTEWFKELFPSVADYLHKASI